jgi:hypothetical protein
MKSYSFPVILALLSATLPAVAQTELEVWPTGVNGPMTWPPELRNPWWDAEKKYPEGGQPPPLDLFERIKCPGGSKVKIKSANSAPWETSRWHPPEYAFDEYTMSRWSSNNSNEKWLAADMGSEKNLNRAYVIWETAYGKDYDIQVSPDSVVWTTAKQVRGGNGQADVVELNAKGRYVRMMGVATGSPYGYSIYELTLCSGEATGTASKATSSDRGRGRLAPGFGPGGMPMGLRAIRADGKSIPLR